MGYVSHSMLAESAFVSRLVTSFGIGSPEGERILVKESNDGFCSV